MSAFSAFRQLRDAVKPDRFCRERFAGIFSRGLAVGEACGIVAGRRSRLGQQHSPLISKSITGFSRGAAAPLFVLDIRMRAICSSGAGTYPAPRRRQRRIFALGPLEALVDD